LFVLGVIDNLVFLQNAIRLLGVQTMFRPFLEKGKTTSNNTKYWKDSGLSEEKFEIEL